MSRCFPFTPPTCRGEDVFPMGSMKKLQNESGNTKHSKERNTDRKEKENKKSSRRQHSKERNTDRKEKVNKKSSRRQHSRERNTDIKEKENKKSSRRQHGKLGNAEPKKRKLGHNEVTEFFESFPEPKKVASAKLESSSLTEEYELPVSIPNPCNSLESTQNSSKREMLQDADTKRKAQGLLVRIKLPLTKHKELKAVNTEPSCSHEVASISKIRRSSAGAASELKVTPNEEPCFSGRFTEATMVQQFAATDMVFSSRSCSRTPKMDKYFRSLLLNWNPPSLQFDDVTAGAQDWLFGVNRSSSDNGGAKKLKASMPNHSICAASASSLQPRACYLPECEIYQLPYVIPF